MLARGEQAATMGEESLRVTLLALPGGAAGRAVRAAAGAAAPTATSSGSALLGALDGDTECLHRTDLLSGDRTTRDSEVPAHQIASVERSPTDSCGCDARTHTQS